MPLFCLHISEFWSSSSSTTLDMIKELCSLESLYRWLLCCQQFHFRGRNFVFLFLWLCSGCSGCVREDPTRQGIQQHVSFSFPRYSVGISLYSLLFWLPYSYIITINARTVLLWMSYDYSIRIFPFHKLYLRGMLWGYTKVFTLIVNCRRIKSPFDSCHAPALYIL